MSILSNFLPIRKPTRSSVSSGMDCHGKLPRLAVAAVLGFVATLAQPLYAQAGLPGLSPQSTSQSPSSPEFGASSSGLGATDASQSDSSQDDRSRSSSADNLAVPASLSADQIIQILQQNPDLVVELKSQVADRLQQQGTPIDANDISDQMLYNQIATNSDLRANITMFLRARGYVSQDDLQGLRFELERWAVPFWACWTKRHGGKCGL